MARQYVTRGPENTKIYRVDGSAVREHIDTDFIGGGHALVYRWCAEDEIWIEKMRGGRTEEAFLLAHEMVEVLLMRHRRWKYTLAHAKATSIERVLREGADPGWVFDLFVRRYLDDLSANAQNRRKQRLNEAYASYRYLA